MTSDLTEERLTKRDTARRFAMEVVLPIANGLDPERGSIPRAVIGRIAGMGWFGPFLPEEHGGMGLGRFEYCPIAEELSRAWMNVGSLLARGKVPRPGDLDEEQKRRWLPRVARGEVLGAVALSEPATGSDLANLSCRARRFGDDACETTGSKYWVTFADGADQRRDGRAAASIDMNRQPGEERR